MRTLGGFCIALLCAGGLFAQVVRGGFGNVVFPGGTSSTVPGMQRGFGNVVFPGGGGPQGVTARPNALRRGATGSVAIPYAVPVYPSGYYDNSYGPETIAAPAPPPPQQQPNVVVVYPPPATPVIINVSSDGQVTTNTRQPAPPAYQTLPVQPPEAQIPAPAEETTHYLIAFKDHTIYAAVAYWVDGDTLHYFTSGNTHNQVSVSLIDRELTQRLNKESGVEVKLPK